MTTPDRVRQRRNDVGMAVLACLLVLGWLYFQGKSDAQKECLTNYISSNSKTSKVRSDLVARESQTTRHFLLNATDPAVTKTRKEFQKVRNTYVQSLSEIDRARDANPVQPFPKGVCD